MRIPTRWLWLGTWLAFAAHTAGAAPERVTGRVDAIDGDSFRIGGTEIRLFGADAPEGRQSCTRAGSEWNCGEAAASELRRLTRGREVTCTRRDEDDYGRMVATCRAGDADLAAAMVSAGFAVAYRRYSDDYVDEERAARSAKRGLWSGEFTPPDEWRREDRAERGARSDSDGRGRGSGERDAPPAQPKPPRDGCYIKGNVNAKGDKIYHVPSSPMYERTTIDESAGERWFCTEAEARAAGWRAAR